MPHVFRATANTYIWTALPLLLLALIPVSVYLYSAAPAICRLPSFCKDRRLRSHLPGSIFCAAVRRMALLLHESQVLKICWFCAHITQMLLLPCSHWACSSAPGVLEQVSEFISFMARRPWLATLLPWMFLASTHCLRFFGRLLDGLAWFLALVCTPIVLREPLRYACSSQRVRGRPHISRSCDQ